MTAVIRRYEPLEGRLDPAGRFYLDSVGRVSIFFNLQAIEKFGVGVEFRSADLFHSRDRDNGTESIILELYESPYKGQLMLTHMPRNNTTKVCITRFMRQLEIPFQQGTKCPVWVSGSLLYLDLPKSA